MTDPQNSINGACLEKQRENTSRERTFICFPEVAFDLIPAAPGERISTDKIQLLENVHLSERCRTMLGIQSCMLPKC